MPKFKARLFVVTSHYYDVDAASEEEALAIAKQRYEMGAEGDFVDRDDARIHDEDVEVVSE